MSGRRSPEALKRRKVKQLLKLQAKIDAGVLSKDKPNKF